jgi:hypothetical protein
VSQSHIPLNTAKAQAWGEAWRREYRGRYRYLDDGGRGLHPIRALVPDCRDTILALERQINDGQQLSNMKDET